MKVNHFWLKNNNEKLSRKNIFEISLFASHFLLNEFTSERLPMEEFPKTRVVFGSTYKFASVFTDL